MRTTTLLALAVAAVGCSNLALEDARSPTGSTTLVADRAYEGLFAVNVDEDTVSRLDLATSEVEEFSVGDEPTRLVRVGDRLLVTLRGERGLAEVDADTGEVLRTVETGPEPFGIVATQDGRRIFVAVSTGGYVEERDAETLEILRTFAIDGEPRWLGVHPSGETLYVGSAFGETIHWIDLDEGTVGEIDMPVQFAQVFGAPRGPGPFRMSGRVTGDPAVGVYGDVVAFPAFYVDNTSGEPSVNGAPSVPYYQPLPNVGPGRFNGGLVLLKTRKDGTPERGQEAMLLVSDFESSGRLNGDPLQLLRSYPSSVTASPDGLTYLVSLEGSQAVLAVDATSAPHGNLGAVVRPATAVALVDAGPRGVVFVDDDDAYVHSFLDRTISSVRYDIVRGRVQSEVLDFTSSMPFDARVGEPISTPSLAPEVEEGRRLFYSAIDGSMGAAGVSCASCHFDGRNDGLTWFLMNGKRNTPSLVGEVSLTAPVTWTNQVETVAAEAQFTAESRMGSAVLPDAQADKIAAFVDFVRLPDQPDPDSAAVERGREIFFRDAVGCADCHNGAMYADNQPYELYDLEAVNTRPLLGIGATAPYLHDGSAPTLRDLMVRSRDGSMGDTSSLTEAEIDDLVAFLESL